MFTGGSYFGQRNKDLTVFPAFSDQGAAPPGLSPFDYQDL
jgi:hypothetical protein